MILAKVTPQANEEARADPALVDQDLQLELVHPMAVVAALVLVGPAIFDAQADSHCTAPVRFDDCREFVKNLHKSLG